MAYTYDDFMSAAGSSGLMGEFSDYDLDTAKKYPEFGLSILSLKQDYHNASTPEQKLLINEAANELRKSYGNYAGGPQGSDFVSEGKIPTEIDRVLEQIGSYGSFDYGMDAPVYDNKYAQQQQELLDAILNREDFSWSKETDPQWSSYKKSYLREGDWAQQNALAQASAASGGRPSSFAVTAASQAGDYYAGKLNDIIPTLYQQAYDRYLKEYSMMQQDLSAVNNQEQLDYQAYLNNLTQYNTDRNFAYNQYLDEYKQMQDYLGNLQTQDQVDYGRYLDTIGRMDQEKQNQQIMDQQQFENAMAMYQTYGFVPEQFAGVLGLPAGTPTAEQSYRQWNQQQKAAKQSGGGTGGGKTTGNTGGAEVTGGGDGGVSSLVTAFQAGDHSDATIAGLIKAGYTQADLEAAGYTGDYFKRGGIGGTGGKGAQGDAGYGLSDLNTNSVLALGIGPISYSTVEDLAEQGKVEVFTDKNGALSVRWKPGYNAKNYNQGTGGSVFGGIPMFGK